MTVFELFIPGVPEPGGSKRAFIRGGRAQVVDANPRAKPWKSHVSSMAYEAWGRRPLLDGPIELSVLFILSRPRSHFGTGKNAATLKPNAPRWHTTKPDALKLARLIEDALSSIVYVDDSRIAIERLSKEYGSKPGAHIRVSLIEEAHAVACASQVTGMDRAQAAAV